MYVFIYICLVYEDIKIFLLFIPTFLVVKDIAYLFTFINLPLQKYL